MCLPSFSRAFALAFFLGSLMSTIAAEEMPPEKTLSPEEIQIQKDIQSLMVAVQTGDEDTYLKLIHPNTFVRRTGSKEESIKQLKKAKEMFEKLGGVFKTKITVEAKFPEAATFIEAEKHEFAVVPVLTISNFGIAKAEVHTYFLGIRDGENAAWQYMDGTKLDQRDIRDFFADFPIDQPLPLIKTKTIPNEEALDDLIGELPPPPDGL